MTGFREEDLPKPKHELPVEEFLEALKDENYVGDEYLERHTSHVISFNHIPNSKGMRKTHVGDQEYIYIKNCIFIGIPIVNYYEGKEIILQFEHSIISSLNFNDSSIKEIIIDNCIIGNITITTSNIDSILIKNNSNIGDIAMRYLSYCRNFEISNGSKSANISFINYSIADYFTISYDSISENINVENNSQCLLLYINYSQANNIMISGNSIITDTAIENSIINKMDYLCNYGELNFYHSNIKFGHFSNCFISSLKWNATTNGELYFNDCQINYLLLKSSNITKDSVLSFINSSFLVAQFQECIIMGQLLFRNVDNLKKPFIWEPSLNKILIQEITKNNIDRSYEENQELNRQLELLNTHKELHESNLGVKEIFGLESRFILANSSMGKTEITGSNLEKVSFEYRDTKMLDMFISGTKLPKDNIKIFSHEEIEKQYTPKDEHEQKTSVYSQLRKIMENTGNIVEATWYHSKAMEHQGKLLEQEYNAKHGNKPPIKRWFTEEGFELFNFRLNRLSNNHGESWKQALAFLMLSGLVFYSAYCIALASYPPYMEIDVPRLISGFFNFLNPVHGIKYLHDEPNDLAQVIDFFGRLVVGYSIYQFIAAFRRHGRKQG